MTFSMFLASIPPFVWVALIGMIVCFLVGYMSLPAIMEHCKSGFRSDYQVSHNLDVVLWTALGFAFMTIMTCVRYSVQIPGSFFLRILIVPLIIAGTTGLTLLFWGVSILAANVYIGTHHIPKKR